MAFQTMFLGQSRQRLCRRVGNGCNRPRAAARRALRNKEIDRIDRICRIDRISEGFFTGIERPARISLARRDGMSLPPSRNSCPARLSGPGRPAWCPGGANQLLRACGCASSRRQSKLVGGSFRLPEPADSREVRSLRKARETGYAPTLSLSRSGATGLPRLAKAVDLTGVRRLPQSESTTDEHGLTQIAAAAAGTEGLIPATRAPRGTVRPRKPQRA